MGAAREVDAAARTDEADADEDALALREAAEEVVVVAAAAAGRVLGDTPADVLVAVDERLSFDKIDALFADGRVEVEVEVVWEDVALRTEGEAVDDFLTRSGCLAVVSAGLTDVRAAVRVGDRDGAVADGEEV